MNWVHLGEADFCTFGDTRRKTKKRCTVPHHKCSSFNFVFLSNPVQVSHIFPDRSGTSGTGPRYKTQETKLKLSAKNICRTHAASEMLGYFLMPSTCMRSASIVLILLTSTFAGALPLQSIDESKMNITHLSPLSRVLGPWIPGGPCPRNDYRCMNAVGLEYANNLRRLARVPLLRMGTERMLQVGRAHSKAMERAFARRGGKIFHQVISRIPLGCSSWYSGENVGLNYVYKGRSNRTPSNPAKMCITQFNNSPTHKKNLLDATHKEAALAVWIDARDRIWCTHVLAWNTTFAPTGSCKRTTGWRDSHGRTGRGGHVFRARTFALRCSYAWGCRYCSAGKCLAEMLSETVDSKLR